MEVSVVGIELLVDRLDRALDFFHGILGYEVVHRGDSHDADGEIAIVDAGNIAIVLFRPADDGPRVIADRSPRVSQLLFAADGDELPAWRKRIAEHGISTGAAGDRFFVPPDISAGLVGFDVSLTFTANVAEGEEDDHDGPSADGEGARPDVNGS